MGVKEGQTLLVRGGTSSIGMAAATIAKDLGLTVISTTRNETKREALIENGADHVVIDTGEVAEPVRQIFPGGVNAVLELIGTTTLLDSLACCSPKGIVCNTGILGNAWAIEDFQPMAAIPSPVRLTTFLSETVEAANATAALQNAVDAAAEGRYRVNIGSRSRSPSGRERRSPGISKQRLESGLASQSLELGLVPRPGDRQGPTPGSRVLEGGERLLGRSERPGSRRPRRPRLPRGASPRALGPA